jgi:uncharacterized protein YkwD
LQLFLHLPRAARRARKHLSALPAAALLHCLGALGIAAPAIAAKARAQASAAACQGANAAPNGRNSASVDSATLCLMNQVRLAHGLRPLRHNRTLAEIATGQARDMVRGDYFGDQSISGKSPLARIMASGYPIHASSIRVMTAQNIGWGTGANATPAGIVRAWMASPPHRQIILTAVYRDTGVGVAPSVPSGLGAGWSGATYAVEFGARRP